VRARTRSPSHLPGKAAIGTKALGLLFLRRKVASFGFRPGRSAHQAVARAQELIASGHGIVVDIDLEKFLDAVS
jgi:hypothetical protein